MENCGKDSDSSEKRTELSDEVNDSVEASARDKYSVLTEKESSSENESAEASARNKFPLQMEKESSSENVSDSSVTNPEVMHNWVRRMQAEPPESSDDSDSMETDEYETSKFWLHNYFLKYPETEREKKMMKRYVFEDVTLFFRKACEKRESALGNSMTFQLLKKADLLGPDLEFDHSFQQATAAAARLLHQYSWCTHLDSLRREKENFEILVEEKVEKAVNCPDTEAPLPEVYTDLDEECIEGCLEDMYANHLAATSFINAVKERIKIQAFHSQSTEDPNVMPPDFDETDPNLPEGAKYYYNPEALTEWKKEICKSPSIPCALRKENRYRVHLSLKILLDRISFLSYVREMIRSSLRLFRRFNRKWLAPGNTYAERKVKEFKRQFKRTPEEDAKWAEYNKELRKLADKNKTGVAVRETYYEKMMRTREDAQISEFVLKSSAEELSELRKGFWENLDKAFAMLAVAPPAHVAAGAPPAHVAAGAPPAHVAAGAPPAHVAAGAPPAHVAAGAPPAHVAAGAPPAHVAASAPPAHGATETS